MKTTRIVSILLTLILSALLFSMPVLAEESVAVTDAVATDAVATEANAAEEHTAEAQEGESGLKSNKAIWAAICVAVVATAGAIGMAIAIAKSAESMARQPEAAGKINSAMMLGLVFIETAIIYALIVAILIIFVL